MDMAYAALLQCLNQIDPTTKIFDMIYTRQIRGNGNWQKGAKRMGLKTNPLEGIRTHNAIVDCGDRQS